MTVSIPSVGTPSMTPFSVVNPSNLSPGLPPTRANNDVLLLYTTCRSPTPTVATPAGWTGLMNKSTGNGRLVMFGRLVDGNETAPTVTWSGMTAGTAGTPAIAQIAAVRGLQTNLATLVDVGGSTSSLTSATTAAGGIAITTLAADDAVFVFSIYDDDTPAYATLAASDGVAAWAKVAPTVNANSGRFLSHEWQWGVKPAAGAIGDKVFTVSGTGGATASSGMMVALKSLPTTAKMAMIL